MNTLIVVGAIAGTGYYKEFFNAMNARSVEARAVNPNPVSWAENSEADCIRANTIWACREKDVPVIVEELTKIFSGVELRVYSLTGMFTRIPGELKQLSVTKDGALPA